MGSDKISAVGGIKAQSAKIQKFYASLNKKFQGSIFHNLNPSVTGSQNPSGSSFIA